VTTLCVPAHPDFVASVRAVVRSTAVVADLAMEDVEELQIAVNEAAALLLPLAGSTRGSGLSARLEVEPGRLCVRLWITGAQPGAAVDRGSLAWMMLSTLDPELQVVEAGDERAIEVSRARSGSSGA